MQKRKEKEEEEERETEMKHLIEYEGARATYCSIDTPEDEEIATIDDLYGPNRIHITQIECKACQEAFHKIGDEISRLQDKLLRG